MSGYLSQPAFRARTPGAGAFLVLTAALMLAAAVAAPASDGIIAVTENGRTVYVDGPSATPSPQPRRSGALVYWSRS